MLQETSQLAWSDMTTPQPEGSEFAFFIVDGFHDTIVLDNMNMRHVIIRNADVQYDGGLSDLQDVYFVNCVFHSRFKSSPKTAELGKRILAAASVTMRPVGGGRIEFSPNAL
jgi:hypothetical protein